MHEQKLSLKFAKVNENSRTSTAVTKQYLGTYSTVADRGRGTSWAS